MSPSSSKINLILVFILFAALMGFSVRASSAAVEEDSDEMNYAYGKVVSVIAQEIVLAEYDYEKDEEVNETYSIDPKVELQNIESLDHLAAGDEVEIYYDDEPGHRMAVVISRPHVEDTPAESEEGGFDTGEEK